MVRSAIKERIRGVIYPVPAQLKAKQIPNTQQRIDTVRAALEQHYFKGSRARQTMTPEGYASDLDNHVVGRLDFDRNRVIPWLNNARPLHGTAVLEIGCGTGASTIALAEQGARVTAIDIDADALEVARVRCAAYEVNGDIRYSNAAAILDDMKPHSYDVILFFACLEHMTHAERLHSLRRSWELLPDGGLIAIVETPNRLWYYDSHTAQMPLYHWLPDDLAFQYSRFSGRKGFNDRYHELTAENFQHFLRRGRGASFHEFDLAVSPVENLQVKSLREYEMPWSWLRQSRRDKVYTKFIHNLFPKLHSGWFDEYLDLIITKTPAT